MNANCELRRESLTVGSHVQLWQVPVNLDPIEVAHGRVLSSSETWNGKPLVYSTDISRAATSSTSLPNREEVAAEAAIAQLLS